MNNGDNDSLSPRDRILLSHKLHLSCKVVNALLFIFAIILLAVGAYKLRLLNTGLEDCFPASGEDCNNKSSSSAGPYSMIIAGCILILHCAMIFGVMIALARETSKYIRQLSNQLPTYEEAIQTAVYGDTSMDDVLFVYSFRLSCSLSLPNDSVRLDFLQKFIHFLCLLALCPLFSPTRKTPLPPLAHLLCIW